MTLATAFAALLLWGGTGGRASAQPLQHVDPNNVAHVYGAGESTRLTGAAGPVGIYANGQPNAVTGGANIVIHSYNARGHYNDYTTVWKATISGLSSCPGTNWKDVASPWSNIQTDTSTNHPAYPCNRVI